MSKDGSNKQEKIDFPIEFDIKVIVNNDLPENQNLEQILSLLRSINVRYGKYTSKKSENEKYISFSINVKINDDRSFKKLYSELKKLPNLRMAL